MTRQFIKDLLWEVVSPVAMAELVCIAMFVAMIAVWGELLVYAR